MRHILFLLGFALLASHEIDAALAAEWRLLYGLRGLADHPAATLFIMLHVPLFMALLWWLFHPRPKVQRNGRAVFMTFLVVHAGLHLRLSTDPLYGFQGWLSALLIYGAAAAGVLWWMALCRSYLTQFMGFARRLRDNGHEPRARRLGVRKSGE